MRKVRQMVENRSGLMFAAKLDRLFDVNRGRAPRSDHGPDVINLTEVFEGR